MMLRIREIRTYGSPGRYANLDLGREQGTGRGDTSASFHRDIGEGANKRFECFTFIPDTLHNRVTLLQKSTLEVAVLEFDAWRQLGWKDVEYALGPVQEAAAEAKISDEVKAGGEPKPFGEAPFDANYESGLYEQKETPVQVNGIEDFLALSKQEQVLAVKDDGFPESALQEVIDSQDERLSEKAREVAKKKAEKLSKPE